MRRFKMPLINCETSVRLKWSKNCIVVAGTTANQNPRFQINGVPVVFLSTLENIKFLAIRTRIVLK